MRVDASWVCPVALLSVCAIVGCLPGVAPTEADDGDAEAQAEERVIFTGVEIRPGQTSAVTLNQTHVLLPTEAGGERRVPVVLEHSLRPYSVDFTWEGRAYHRSGEVHVYQLRSLDAEVPYEWAMVYHGDPMDQVKLFACGSNRNYLVWVRGPGVLLAEMSEARDSRTAVMELYLGQVSFPLHHVLPRDVVGGRPFGVDAQKSDLHLVSLDRSEAGEFTLKVHGTDPGTVFTLVSADGETWQQQ